MCGEAAPTGVHEGGSRRQSRHAKIKRDFSQTVYRRRRRRKTVRTGHKEIHQRVCCDVCFGELGKDKKERITNGPHAIESELTYGKKKYEVKKQSRGNCKGKGRTFRDEGN